MQIMLEIMKSMLNLSHLFEYSDSEFNTWAFAIFNPDRLIKISNVNTFDFILNLFSPCRFSTN